MDRSVIMEAFRDRFIAAELLSYKEVLFQEGTEEWYAKRDPIEVDWVESVKLNNLRISWKSIESGSSPTHSFNHKTVWQHI